LIGALSRYDAASRGEADSSGKRLPTPQFGHERKNAPGRAGLESAKSGSNSFEQRTRPPHFSIAPQILGKIFQPVA
jgi:hypothetical protein